MLGAGLSMGSGYARPQPALPPCALPRVMGRNHGPSPARRKEWEQRQQAGRAPGDLSLSIPTLSSPGSHHLGSESCCGLSKGTEQGCGMQLGTELSPEPSMSRGGRAPCSQHSHHPAVLSWALTNLPTVPVLPQERKRRACVSLPIVLTYSPKCWQDSCALVTWFSSTSAPSHTVLPSGPFKPPLFTFPLLPLTIFHYQHPSSHCPPTSHCSSHGTQRCWGRGCGNGVSRRTT